MRIQNLAIIFLIIILPISIVLSAYTQFQIKTLNLQTDYDTRLTSATYDAIKAFQINTADSTMSDLSNSKLRDIEASVETFKTSMMTTFKLTGYTEDDLNSYIPALVYTMYDGFYIYSPYQNTIYSEEGNREQYTTNKGSENRMYGLKPYITYSCRYKIDGNNDFVITYSLDNYITIQGTVDGKYVNKDGYLISNITVNGDSVKYNGIEIPQESLVENVNGTNYKYAKINGTKYYLDGNEIFYISNGRRVSQVVKPERIITPSDRTNQEIYLSYERAINNNTSAKTYYKNAYEFTKWIMGKKVLKDLKYGDALDENGKKIWDNSANSNIARTKIFDENNIENELSNFNQHRMAILRYKIESALKIAISNYNNYSGSESQFQMPNLNDEEWSRVIDSISLISFVQGLSIGGKIYNGYSIVNNTESQEVVLEENIYILTTDNNYCKIGDVKLTENSGNNIAGNSAGRANLDFIRHTLRTDTETKYYYPLKDYYASYNSIITQNKMDSYEDIYQYVGSKNDKLKTAFYTAIGRERQGQYKALRTDI